MAGDSKEMTCAHHLEARGIPVLDQDRGGQLYLFIGSVTGDRPCEL
jgi:hypothetical protein